MSQIKTYLGDGAYAAFDGYSVILTTSDGVSDTNTIYMEPEVVQVLMTFFTEVEKLKETMRAANA